jgi:hypothetical protein
MKCDEIQMEQTKLIFIIWRGKLVHRDSNTCFTERLSKLSMSSTYNFQDALNKPRASSTAPTSSPSADLLAALDGPTIISSPSVPNNLAESRSWHDLRGQGHPCGQQAQ